jgi:TonB family protein
MKPLRRNVARCARSRRTYGGLPESGTGSILRGAVRFAGLFFVAALLALAPLTAGPRAFAQDAAPTVRPPRLAGGTRPVAPAGLEAERVEVLLEIVVGADGAVRDVRVVEPVGRGFDEAALEAARTFRFDPAMRGDTPMAARIRYAVAFEPLEPSPAVAATDQPDGAETAPSGAEAAAEPEASAEESSGEERGGGAAPDAEVRATQAGLEGAVDPDTIPDEELATFGATAVVEPPPREATRRTLTSEVLTRIPGTRGDALRAVELLPGVGRPAFGGGNLLVRGAAPGDSEVFLDGSSVPLLYHFGGLTSFYNSTLLERIDFMPGNFGVRYGRRIGGILEVDPRDPRRDGYHGYLDVNLLDASLVVEGPIGDNVSVAVAARRSYIDFFFNEIVPDGVFNVVAAPVYYDYQVNVVWRPTDTDRIRFFLYGSSDELRLVFNAPSDNDPNVRGNFGIVTQFHRGQISWRHLYDANVEQDVMISFGWTQLLLGFGEATRLELSTLPIQLRSEWRAQISPTVRLIGGLDWQYSPTDISFRGAQPTQSEGMPNMAAQAGSRVSLDARANAYRPGLYLESSVRVIPELDIVAGIRVDYFREIQSWTADPRATGRLRLTPSSDDVQVALRAGVGAFSQPPEFAESAVNVGNPNLDPIRAIHTSLGGDLRLVPQRLSFTLDGFYKHIVDRVVGTPGGVAPFYTNQGIGRIYGLEVGARLEPGSSIPVFGFLSYTLMRSERQDGPGQPWRLFDFDQTHILTAAAVWTIGDGWEAGLTFRLVSGNPYTPVVGSINDLSTGVYRPVYGAVNSDRNPFFHRLDVRVQKRFDIGDFRLILYVDVQNVYNATNREGVSYNYDYTRSTDVPGLPIIPSLGIRGEL